MKRTALLTAATLLLLAGTAVNALAQNDTTTVPKADTVTTTQTAGTGTSHPEYLSGTVSPSGFRSRPSSA